MCEASCYLTHLEEPVRDFFGAKFLLLFLVLLPLENADSAKVEISHRNVRGIIKLSFLRSKFLVKNQRERKRMITSECQIAIQGVWQSSLCLYWEPGRDLTLDVPHQVPNHQPVLCSSFVFSCFEKPHFLKRLSWSRRGRYWKSVLWDEKRLGFLPSAQSGAEENAAHVINLQEKPCPKLQKQSL